MNKNPYNLDKTISVARSVFAKKPALEMATNSGCLYDLNKQRFTVSCLGQKYGVSYPKGHVTANCGQSEAPLITSILLLHYLSHSTGTTLSQNWISYKDLPGGSLYLEPFKKRAVIPFVKKFGGSPDDFVLAAEKLGGEKAKHGDISYIIPALPRVPLLYILWQGNEEFPPNATVLFDDCAHSYLHTEDYAILAGMTVGALLAAIKS